MVQRVQKARSRHEFEREERLASDTLSGGANKRGKGTNLGGRGSIAADPEGMGRTNWSRGRARRKLSSSAGHAKATKESKHRADSSQVVASGGNRGRRAGETGTLRSRNAGGNRPRHTGMGGMKRAPASRARTPARQDPPIRRRSGSQALGGPRGKSAATPATARRKTQANKGR